MYIVIVVPAGTEYLPQEDLSNFPSCTGFRGVKSTKKQSGQVASWRPMQT